MSYYPEPDSNSGKKIKLDFANYATKNELKKDSRY